MLQITVAPSSRLKLQRAAERVPDGWIVSFKEPTRTDLQNARMWVMLRDISHQVEWYGQKLHEEEWKDVFTAAIRKEKVVPGINGGFVVVGRRTSKMGVKEMSLMIELMEAFGGEHQVRWSNELPEQKASAGGERL